MLRGKEGQKLDRDFMRRALTLARRGLGRTSPNPAVGAVVVREGRIVGEGYHHKAGSPHAEVHALRQAGDRAEGATLYVTLEPCSHYGRTPPCAEAIIAAGIKRVVAALTDPNPKVSGSGLALLNHRGIKVEVGVEAERAREINEAFFKFITTGLPWVILKFAASLDGKIATRTGDSRWISGGKSRMLVHRLRNQVDAVMVGIGTVLADDPQLTTRMISHGRDPLRVIVDSSLQLPLEAAVVQMPSSKARTLVATTVHCDSSRRQDLEALGVEVIVVPGEAPRVDLAELFKVLGRRQITSVLLEGGPTLTASALTAGLVDKVWAFIAPKIIGGIQAPGAVAGEGPAFLGEARSLENISWRRVGEDLVITGYL